MKNYILDYVNENEYKKKEKAIKKYNMLAYKKLIFEYYNDLRDGNFQGVCVETDKQNGISKYELKLPTDKMFANVHGPLMLHYIVYEKQKMVMLNTLTPEDVLTEGHMEELSTYKGVMVTNSHKEKDMFKINLFNAMRKDGFTMVGGLAMIAGIAIMIITMIAIIF